MEKTADISKPTGRQHTYVFTNGDRLNLFGVTDVNLSGAWYRVTDHTGALYVIDPAKVLYSVNKMIS